MNFAAFDDFLHTIHVLMVNSFVIPIMTFLLPLQPALADDAINFYNLPHDFELLSPTQPVPSGGPFPYSSTGGNPTWSIASWGITAGNLQPFIRSGENNGRVIFTSNSNEARVDIMIQQKSPSPSTYILHQDGSGLPASDSFGFPHEFDLFASPNSYQVHNISLASLSKLNVNANVSFSFSDLSYISGSLPSVSQAGATIAVIFNNPKTKQTLFYQLIIGEACGTQQPAARLNWCLANMAHPKPYYFSQTHPFGTDDFLPAMGEPFLQNGETRLINVDILSRVEAMIQDAPQDMDKNLADWMVGAYYNGTSIWGHMMITTQWSDVSVTGYRR